MNVQTKRCELRVDPADCRAQLPAGFCEDHKVIHKVAVEDAAISSKHLKGCILGEQVEGGEREQTLDNDEDDIY